MTGQELYDGIKEGLSRFGLKFSEMDKITVSVEDHYIVLNYEDEQFKAEFSLDTTEYVK